MKALVRRSRWWDTSYKGLGDKVNEGVTDALQISDGERALNVLNLCDQSLNEEEVADLQTAFQAVITLTQGKILDRVRGVALLPDDSFKPSDAGGFSKHGRILALNMDSIRSGLAYLKTNPHVQTRYDRYFKNKNVSFMTMLIAHELGHAMDILEVDEAERSGVDPAKAAGRMANQLSGVSYFQSQFGWKNYATEQREFDKEEHWRIDDTEAIECREFPLTSYARTSPEEDYAEAFAVTALGGDMDSAPQRQRVVMQSIQNANGNEWQNGVHVTIQHITPESGKIQATLKPSYKMAAYIKNS